MTLGANVCDQWVELGRVVTGCGQWVIDILYLIMKYPYSYCVSAFWLPHLYFLFNFCKLFFILVYVCNIFRFFKSHKGENY